MEWKHPQSPSKKKVQKPTIHKKLDVYTILGLIRPQYWNIIRRGAQQ
jgi:hypothetical protein